MQSNRVYHYTTVDPFLLLPRNVVIAPLFGENSDTVGPQNGYSVPEQSQFHREFWWVCFAGRTVCRSSISICRRFAAAM